jgi:hypothetical protein
VRDAIENDLLRGRLSSLDRVLPGISVQKNVQLRDFRDPTTVDLAVKLNRELHSVSLTLGDRSTHGGRRRGPRWLDVQFHAHPLAQSHEIG